MLVLLIQFLYLCRAFGIQRAQNVKDKFFMGMMISIRVIHHVVRYVIHAHEVSLFPLFQLVCFRIQQVQKNRIVLVIVVEGIKQCGHGVYFPGSFSIIIVLQASIHIMSSRFMTNGEACVLKMP